MFIPNTFSNLYFHARNLFLSLFFSRHSFIQIILLDVLFYISSDNKIRKDHSPLCFYSYVCNSEFSSIYHTFFINKAEILTVVPVKSPISTVQGCPVLSCGIGTAGAMPAVASAGTVNESNTP